MLRAGKLRHRVQIVQAPDGADVEGNPNAEWDPVATVWADVELTGEQVTSSDRDTDAAAGTIRIRYRTGINTGMRAVHDGIRYDIVGVSPDGRRRTIDLVVRQP